MASVGLGWFVGSALVGLALTVVAHGVAFGRPGAGWVFGTMAVLLASVAGLVLNARSLAAASARSAGLAAIGGLARMVALVMAWRIAVRLGIPERESALTMVLMGVTMMVAEVAQAARAANAQRC